MYFLVRMAFWLTLVLVLLPTDKSADTDTKESIDTMAAATAAAAAMSDMSQFCTRQPTACEVGGKAAVAIGERAQSGARKVYQFLTEKDEKRLREETRASDERKDERRDERRTADEGKSLESGRKAGADKARKSSDHTGLIGGRGSEAAIDGAWRGTLNDDDLAIEWRPAVMAGAGLAG